MAEHRDIEEAAPGRRREASQLIGPATGQEQQQHDGRREHQRPGDHLPAADAPRHLAAQRIGHGGRERRGGQQQVGPVQIAGTAAGQQRVDQHRRRSRHAAGPEPQGRPLARTSTPAMAVSSGSTASTTAPCEAGAYCMAIVISSGKPTIEQTANAASRGQSRRCGGCGRATAM